MAFYTMKANKERVKQLKKFSTFQTLSYNLIKKCTLIHKTWCVLATMLFTCSMLIFNGNWIVLYCETLFRFKCENNGLFIFFFFFRNRRRTSSEYFFFFKINRIISFHRFFQQSYNVSTEWVIPNGPHSIMLKNRFDAKTTNWWTNSHFSFEIVFPIYNSIKQNCYRHWQCTINSFSWFQLSSIFCSAQIDTENICA